MKYLYSSARTLSSGRIGLLTVIFSLTLFGSLSAQEIEVFEPVAAVGASPAQIIPDSATGYLHVLSAGLDANFNGIVEPGEGDISASWHIVDRQGNLVDSLSFDAFFNSYPVRADVNLWTGRLYAPVGGVLRSYDIETMELVDGSVFEMPVAGVTFDQERDLLAVSLRADDFTSPGTIYYIDPENGEIVGQLLAGPNPADGFTTEPDPETGIYRIYTLNEGDGSENSSLSMVGWTDNVYDRSGETEGFGGGIEMGMMHEDRVYFGLANASMIRILDATTHEDVSGSPIEIPGGPQVFGIDVNDEWVAVIAEGGALFVYDRTSLDLLHQIKVPGTARRVAIGDGRLYVAGPFNSKGVAQNVITVAETDSSTRTIQVGSAPSNIWSLGGDQVLVVGEDNGMGEGWWRVVGAESGETVRSGTIPLENFDGGIRAAFNRDAMSLGVLTRPELYEIDITVDDAEPVVVWNPEDAYADRLVAADGIWYLGNFPGDFLPDPSWIYGVEVGSGRELGRVVTNISVPMVPVPALSSVEGAGAFYAIPAFPYGGPDPDVVYVEHHRNIFEGELGILATDIARGESHCWEEPMTMVTVGGSHEVVMLENMNGNPTVALRTPTGTNGFDGPRATVPAPCVPAIYCGVVMTSTYGGEILLLYEGNVIDRADLPGRGEGLALLGDSVYAANVLKKGTFDSPMTTISPISVVWPPGSVASEILPEGSLSVFPNHIVDRMQVRLTTTEPGEAAIGLVDLQGRSVMPEKSLRVEVGTETIDLDLSTLPVGAYMLYVATPEGRGARIVRVVR